MSPAQVRDPMLAHALEVQQRAALMRIYKRRMPNDDGWTYVAASTKGHAARFWNCKRDEVFPTTANECREIAARALIGEGRVSD